MQTITHQQAFDLLKKYNKDSFHIQHALTVEAVMKWYANELGYGEDAEYWGIVGLLHDIDFELYPAEHCLKAPELLREAGVGEDVIHAVCSHGYGITVECGATIDVERAAFQPPVTQFFACLANCIQLRMGQCIFVRIPAVISTGNHLAILVPHNDTADGDFIDGICFFCLFYRLFHIFFICRHYCYILYRLIFCKADIFSSEPLHATICFSQCQTIVCRKMPHGAIHKTYILPDRWACTTDLPQ